MEPHPHLSHIHILHEAGNWPEHAHSIIREALSPIQDMIKDRELSILLTDNAAIRALNKTYRGKDKPTNVLSFPQDEDSFMLGDIALALETISDEAAEQNKSFRDHLIHLVIHGTLHLLGYDHETDDDAEKMEALEIQILKAMSIKNPYEDNDFEV